MKKSLLGTAAAAALVAGGAHAAGHLPFNEGEGAFNWDSPMIHDTNIYANDWITDDIDCELMLRL